MYFEIEPYLQDTKILDVLPQQWPLGCGSRELNQVYVCFGVRPIRRAVPVQSPRLPEGDLVRSRASGHTHPSHNTSSMLVS